MIIDRRAAWRGSAVVALALVAGLTLPTSAMAAPPAAAVPATPVASAAAAPTVHEIDVRRAFERIIRTYGAPDDATKQIVISPETTQVILDPDILIRGPEVYCGPIVDAVSPLAGYFATSDEWTANPTPTVAVVPGAVQAGSGAVFGYGCNSGEEESDRVVWQFVEGPGAGETITLGSDDALLVSRDRTLDWAEGPDAGEPETAAFGDAFVVSGAPGLWPTAANTETSALMYVSGGGAPVVTLENVAINADGSELSFSIPTDVDSRYLNNDGEIVVSANYAEPGVSGSTQIERTRWAAYVYFPGPAKVASHTSATLDRTYSLSVLRSKLTVKVTTDALPNDSGYIAINIDGKDQITRLIPPAGSTTLTLTLPKLARGVHHIYVRYLGTTNVEESTSGKLRLRVLI